MTKQIVYRARLSWRTGVEKLVVDKVTDKSVWLEGRKLARTTQDVRITDTFDEAKQRLMEHLRGEMEHCLKRLEKIESMLLAASAIEESTVEESTSRY